MDTVENLGLSEEQQAMLDHALIEAHESDTILPTNSATLLVDESSSRFSSASWFNKIQTQSVSLIGLGGIGSYVAFLLGRIKIRDLYLYDFDTVEEGNLSGQLYSIEDVGTLKRQAIANKIRKYSNHHFIYSSGEFTASHSVTPITIGALDNMATRRLVFLTWKRYIDRLPVSERENCLLIDGRLAAEEFQVFCMRGSDKYLIDKYACEWLFDDSAAEETLCSYKQTSFCANMIASVMVNLLVNHVANLCDPLIPRELPFYTRYDAERMYFKTEM